MKTKSTLCSEAYRQGDADERRGLPWRKHDDPEVAESYRFGREHAGPLPPPREKMH
jgi:hypothetical protein